MQKLLVLALLVCVGFSSQTNNIRRNVSGGQSAGEQGEAETLGRQVNTLAIACDLCDINNGGCDSQAICTCRTRDVDGITRPVVSCNCLSGWHGNGITCTNAEQICRDDSQCSPGLFCNRDNVLPTVCRSTVPGRCRASKCQSDTTFCAEKHGEGEGEGERMNIPAASRTCVNLGEDHARCVQATTSGHCSTCECAQNGICHRIGGGFCKDNQGNCVSCGATADRCSLNGRCVCGTQNDICSGVDVCLQGRCCSQTTCATTNDCCGGNQCVNGNCRPLYATCGAIDCNYHGTASNVVPFCTCQCNPDWIGTFCDIAVNECKVNNGGCSQYATCTPGAPGQASCACQSGFTGNGIVCSDVNECSTTWGGCDHNGGCNNTPGSRLCGPCNCGFESEGSACIDKNECLVDNGGCDPLATCTNQPGYLSCQCPNGYIDKPNTPPGYECIFASPLVALLTFEDSTNPGKDTSVYGNDLLPSEGQNIVSVVGQHGKAAQFTPPGYLTTDLPSYFPLGNQDYTVMAWVYFPPSVTNHADGIAAWGHPGEIDHIVALRSHYPRDYSNFPFRMYWWGDDLDVTVGTVTGQTWYHIASTYDSAAETRKIYWNGVVVGSDTPSVRQVDTGSFSVGFTGWDIEYMEGRLDDVAVFNIALTISQIQAAMNTGDFSAYINPP